MSNFVQDAPHHENAFTSDAFLIRCLKRLLPADDYSVIEPDLIKFGHRVRSDIWQLGQQCEAEVPKLRPTSAWGRQGHELVTSSAWQAQKAIAAEEGLIAIPYENKHGQFSRIYQVAKLMLYSPASGLYSCPLAMTDGAATTLMSCDQSLPEINEAFGNLTSRNPNIFWTSGQWMTEKRGGSDVSQATETVAVPTEENPGLSFALSGYKWFSSATDSDMSLVLARRTGGLDLFFVRTRDSLTNQPNGIRIEKLKNKLGTHQLPTAELTLDGTKALLLSEEGRGVAKVSSMLNITRLHNVIMSVATQRKMVNLARDYSNRRRAFGKYSCCFY